MKVTHQGGESVVQDDTTALIGSDATATIRIVRPGISRRHAVVSRDSSGWKVQDAGSRNGTFLDGQRVQVVSIEGPTTLFLGHPSDGEAVSFVPSSTGNAVATSQPTASGAKSTQPLPAATPSKDASTAGRASTPAGSAAAPPPAAAVAAAGTGSSAKGTQAAKAPEARSASRTTAPARAASPVQASDIEVAQLTAAIRDQISAIKGLTWSVWAMIAVTAALIVLTLFVGILSN